MITLYFKSFMKKTIQIKVNLNDFIFDAINNALLQNSHINSLSIKNNEKIYYFGYDLKLNKKYEDYFFKENNNYTIWTFSVLDPLSNKFKIEYPILYYNNNKEWPPSDNWNEGDPINLGPFLIWNGYGRGSINVKKEINNSYNHLIILKYGNVKKVVNKFSYMLAIMSSSTKSKDPLTNQLIQNASLLKLYSTFLKKTKNNELLTEIELAFLEIPTIATM